MSAIIIAPFSNSATRDWPVEHFEKLVGHLLRDWPHKHGLIRIVGTGSQRQRANLIVRAYPADRVLNDCGRLPWPMVMSELRNAACVIGNNSGISHLAGSLGVPTVCIFGGSHQRLEWRPLGFTVTVLSQRIGCSPCHLDHARKCGYGLACLREISPQEVAGAVLNAINAGSRPVAVGERKSSANSKKEQELTA
jgi:ADP-heptose:LPS heptosyltransferase